MIDDNGFQTSDQISYKMQLDPLPNLNPGDPYAPKKGPLPIYVTELLKIEGFTLYDTPDMEQILNTAEKCEDSKSVTACLTRECEKQGFRLYAHFNGLKNRN